MRLKNLIYLFILSSFCTLSHPLFAQSKQRIDLLERLKWINIEALELVINDLQNEKGFDVDNAKLNLDYIKKNYASVCQNINGSDSIAAFKEAQTLLNKQREIVMSNPFLDFDKIITTRYTLNNRARIATTNDMCMPSANYMGLIEVPASGYNAEICEFTSLKDNNPTRKTVYKPQNGEGIADLHMHWNADKMMFAMSKPVVIDAFYNQAYPHWHIFEVGTDGNNLTHVSKVPEPDLEFADPCYLPDGRVLFTTNIGYNGIPCEHGERIIMNLAIYDPKDKSMRKIAFDQDGNWSPSVLENGRIMYTRYEYTDLTHYFSRIVMHSNPDGTECKALYGSNSYWPTSVFDMQQVPNTNNKFIGIVSGHHGTPRAGKLIVFDPSVSRSEAEGVVQEIPFKDRKVEPIIRDRLVDGIYPQFSRPFPINDKYFLVTAKPHKGALWGIYLVDIFDNMVLIAENEGDGYLTPIPVKKRPVPPVIPDRIVKGDKEATVFIQDLYTGEGLHGVPLNTVKKLRVFAYEYAYMKSPSDFDALGVQSGWDLKRELGTVAVEADGSAIFKIPANTPVSLQPLDENGNAIQWMRSWFTAMPGEVVSCIGCHEDQSMVPIPKKVIASNKKPAKLETPEGGVRPFSYELEVQPILDRNCVSCHNGTNELADLSGKTKTEYVRWAIYTTHRHMNDSYFVLHPLVYRQGPEAEIKVLNPYEYHASNSELIQMIDKGHHGVKLNDKDHNTLCKWIDFNAPYFGDFEIAGRYKGTFEQYPRRQQLMQKYANVSTDWKRELKDYANYLKGQEEVVPTKTVQSTKADKTSKKSKATMPKWGFDEKMAKNIQLTSTNSIIKNIEIAPGVNMEFTWIPSGKYLMGEDKGGKHAVNHKDVNVDKGFWMGTIEVSNTQFGAIFPEHDSRFIGQQWKDHTTPGYPANNPEQSAIRMTWDKAMEYCQILSKRTGLNMTLPTEEQWEWACRAGSTSDMWYGDRSDDYSEYENLADLTIRDLAVYGLEPTIPMPYDFFCREFWDYVPRDTFANDKNLISVKGGQYKPNPWGLYDMQGNVAEWTRSGAKGNERYEGNKVVCGGSWRDRADKATASTRRFFKPWQSPYNVGFRVIIEGNEAPNFTAQRK